MSTSSNLPFRFTTGRKPKVLTLAAYREIVSGQKELNKARWNERMERYKRENLIIYEILPASTPGYVRLHHVETKKGVCVSDTWETVPENDLKVELWQVRIAASTNPPPLQASPLRGQTRPGSTASPPSSGSTGRTEVDVPMEHTPHGRTVTNAGVSSDSNSTSGMAMQTDD